MSVAYTLILGLAFVYTMLWISKNSTHEPKATELPSNRRKTRHVIRPFVSKSKYSTALMYIDKK